MKLRDADETVFDSMQAGRRNLLLLSPGKMKVMGHMFVGNVSVNLLEHTVL
jgi:hypothetical protein